MSIILAGILVWISGALCGIWWKVRSYKNKVHQASYDQGYERAMLFYRDVKPSAPGNPNDVLKDWPKGDSSLPELSDIRSYTPGPGKPPSTGPAEYVAGHEMGSHPGDARPGSHEMGQ